MEPQGSQLIHIHPPLSSKDRMNTAHPHDEATTEKCLEALDPNNELLQKYVQD